MRPIVFIFSSVLLSLHAKAQALWPTLEDGKEWTVVKPLGMGSTSTHIYHINCDTTINGTRYFMTRRNNGTLLGFVREDTALGQIFELNTNTMQEDKIIDYNLQTGDTIYYVDPFNYEFVDSVTTDFLYQKHRKVIHINSVTKYIEGVGSSNYGVATNITSMYCILNNVKSYATCSQSPAIVEDETKSIKIYPCPVANNLKIDIEGFAEPNEIRCYDILGRVLLHAKFTTVVDVSWFRSGVYFLKLDHQHPIKFIKE